MPDSLPPEAMAAFDAVEGHDRATLSTPRARVEMHREGGRITATLTSTAPEMDHPPVTITGAFPTYAAAFLALSDDIAAAVEHARSGLPRH